MYNKDQLGYMEWLHKQPRETLCQCGWYMKDEHSGQFPCATCYSNDELGKNPSCSNLCVMLDRWKAGNLWKEDENGRKPDELSS
jgi:hypothetical protein